MHFYRRDLQVNFWFCPSVLQHTPNVSVYFCLIKRLNKSEMFSINIQVYTYSTPRFSA